MKKFTSKTQKIGKLGENIVCQHLISKGFLIIDRNFTRKWGEIDVVAKKQGITHFIEVKSVSCESFLRPEDQMTTLKQRKMIRVINSYIAIHDMGNWVFDVACVYIDSINRKARVKIINDVILGS